MRSDRRPLSPLDAAGLDRLALRYVERFATTRARLAAYLTRKVRERGWEGDPPQTAALAERMAELGYVDDRAYGEAKAAALERRGLGPRRVRDALRHAGVTGADAERIEEGAQEGAEAAALAFARRKRFGPFASAPADRIAQQKQIATMMRAGHALDLSRRIVALDPDDQFGTAINEL